LHSRRSPSSHSNSRPTYQFQYSSINRSQSQRLVHSRHSISTPSIVLHAATWFGLVYRSVNLVSWWSSISLFYRYCHDIVIKYGLRYGMAIASTSASDVDLWKNHRISSNSINRSLRYQRSLYTHDIVCCHCYPPIVLFAALVSSVLYGPSKDGVINCIAPSRCISICEYNLL
jgi:hypothetical protein